MIIKEVYEGIYFDVDVDEYITLGIVKENTGIYCMVKPKVNDAIKFVKGSGNYYTRMEITKGILKGTEIHPTENTLDISQVLKYRGDNVYVIESLNICVSCEPDYTIKVYQSEKDMKNLEVF